MLSPSDVAFYREQGYLVVPDVLDATTLDTVRGELMTKVYKRQESIRTALQLAEQEGQRLLDADLARSARG